jgi:glycerol-3-phosphate acyltransferase PlsY
MDSVLPVLLGYGLGSLPLGYLVASRAKGIDLRRVGSGNVGATNAYRTAGLAAALIVILVDVAKGASSVFFAARFASGAADPVAAGVAAIIGHVYPVWLRFHGGKGVATAAGVFAVLTPVALAAASVVFLAAVSVTRFISVGSIAAAIALAIGAAATDAPAVVTVGAAVAAAIIIHRHRANLGRLIAGTERRVGQRLFKET